MNASSVPVVDVSSLPTHHFGHKGLIWWGTVGFMVIEGAMFIMVLVAYFVLRTRTDQWPPSLPNPDLAFGTINTLVMLVSLAPNQVVKKAAERYDLHRVQLYMPVMLLFGIVVLIIRAFEFGALNCSWDDNAYASIVWFILGLHTFHMATDAVDTGVLAALMFTAHVEPKRYVDVSENSLYWYFVVLSWIPVYLVIYFGPRWL
jgi:heme/copper-type cytochrome/quinol oxidase subunit 3